MVLDISYYSSLTKVILQQKEIREDFFSPCDIGGRNEHLDPDECYKAELIDSFRAGAYSGYNRWRERLAKMAGYPETLISDEYYGDRMLCAAACWAGAPGIFSELINFPNNEGTIGPKTCAKLAKDFNEFTPLDAGPSFMSTYNNFKTAFNSVGDSGCVDFH